MADLKTKPDVELVSVGVWSASTGVTKITRDDLEAMLAAHNDGLVDKAPVKLGHVSDLNRGIGDGEPAYGWVIPTRIGPGANGRDTLYGDLVGMPSMLADIADTAYRRRSVEIAWGVETPDGRKYRAALVGVALLGAAAPAVKGLADIAALYTAGEETVDHLDRIDIVAGLEDNPVASAMLAAAARAGADASQLDTMTMAATPSDTSAVPHTPAARGNDEPNAHQTPEKGASMAGKTDDELREQLGLEQDADVKAALEALLADRDTAGAPASETVTDPAGTEAAPAATADPAPAATADPAAAPADVVTLSAATYAELTKLAADNQKARRDKLVEDAFKAGKITKSETTAYRAAADRDEEGTTTLLAALAPKFPTSELGYDAAPDSPAADQATEDAWKAWESGADMSAR